MTRTFTAVVHREGDIYVADCPEIGTVSQGDSFDAAVTNLIEATELYLEDFPVDDASISRSWVTTFEVAVHA